MPVKWRGFHIPIIILSLLGGLALFFGGQFLYNKYNYEQPLENIFSNNEYVQSYNIEKKSGTVHIDIEIKPNGDVNIAQVYKTLYQDSKDVLGRENFTIALNDNPDSDLQAAWEKSQYFVHQAIMLGNFPEMAEQIENFTAENNAIAKVYVEHENIYVQMYKENGHNLLRVISRRNNNAITTGGGAND